MKKKVLFTSILTIVLCLSLISGATLALFTNKSEVNIAVTSARVKMLASIENFTLYSVEAKTGGSIVDERGGTYEYVERADDKFFNGGSATLNGSTITLDKVTPGDKIAFGLKGTNESNVTIKYRYIIECAGDVELMKGLIVYVNGVAYPALKSYTSAWTTLEVDGIVSDVEIAVELPVKAGNEYQEKTTSINVSIEAVQGNAIAEDAPTVIYYDENGESYYALVMDEAGFLKAIATGGRIELGANIALSGESTVLSKDAKINLNGYTLSATRPYNESNDNANAVLAVSGASLEIIGDGEINNNGYCALLLTDGAKVTIESGTFIADTSAIYVQSGELFIKDGFYQARSATSPVPDFTRTWEGQTYIMYLAAVINCSKGAYINYCDGNFDEAWANVDISGGIFVNEDPSNLYEGWIINESHLIDGYKVVRSEQANGDAWYSVVPE